MKQMGFTRPPNWLLTAILLSALLSGCQPVQQFSQAQETSEPMTNEQLYSAQDTGQIIVEGDKLRIGVGNLEGATAEGPSEAEHTTTTAGLWLFFRDKPDSDQHVRLAEGDKLAIEGYTIRMVEIDLNNGIVVLGVTPSSGGDER